MAQPGSDPRWNTDASNRTDPASGQKDSGWTLNQAPPSSYFNWWMNLVYQWCLYLKNLAGEALTWTNNHIFQKGIVVTMSTANGTAAVTTGNGTGHGITANASANAASIGVNGVASAGVAILGTGAVAGVKGQTASTTGKGVLATASAAGGVGLCATASHVDARPLEVLGLENTNVAAALIIGGSNEINGTGDAGMALQLIGGGAKDEDSSGNSALGLGVFGGPSYGNSADPEGGQSAGDAAIMSGGWINRAQNEDGRAGAGLVLYGGNAYDGDENGGVLSDTAPGAGGGEGLIVTGGILQSSDGTEAGVSIRADAIKAVGHVRIQSGGVGGWVFMEGEAPAVTSGPINTLHCDSVPKAMALLRIKGTAGIDVLGGFNIASVGYQSASGGKIAITLDSPITRATRITMAPPGFFIFGCEMEGATDGNSDSQITIQTFYLGGTQVTSNYNVTDLSPNGYLLKVVVYGPM